MCAISVTFFLVGCASLAGDPSAFAERQLVAQRKWLTAPAFRSFRILSRVTPGLPPVNLAVAIGRRLHGVAGSLAAVSGMLAAPMAAALTAGLLYLLYGVHMPYASTMPDASTMFSTGNFLSGLASASAGLAFAAGARGFRRIGLTPGHALVVLFMAAAYAFGHLPFVLVVALAMPLSLIVALVKGHKVKPVDEANG
ncbi:MAG TPA: chromate transporter [Parvibaculum sp.]